MSEVYFIRPTESVKDHEIVAPRTRDTLRMSLDKSLCVLAFPSDQVPEGWEDGMDARTITKAINSQEAAGIWYNPEELAPLP